MSEALHKLESEKEGTENIQDVFAAFEKGEISEEDALKLLEKFRTSRHSMLERYLAFLSKK